MTTHPVAEKCPLHVYLAPTDDDQLPGMQSFVQGIAGVDARFFVVDNGQISSVLDRKQRAPAEMVVVERTGYEKGTDITEIVLNSPVPVMVLPRELATESSPSPLERVLVPLDGSARAAQALPLAKHIAMGAGLPVQFVMVIDPSRVIPPAYAYDPDAWNIINELRETAHWALRQVEQSLEQAGIEVQSELLFGPVNASLQAQIRSSDLLVMTTHGSGKARTRVGSVAARVLASAEGPVIIHRGSEPGDVVVDGYEACSWVEPLSRRTVMASR